jgi:hypothetical protein
MVHTLLTQLASKLRNAAHVHLGCAVDSIEPVYYQWIKRADSKAEHSSAQASAPGRDIVADSKAEHSSVQTSAHGRDIVADSKAEHSSVQTSALDRDIVADLERTIHLGYETDGYQVIYDATVSSSGRGYNLEQTLTIVQPDIPIQVYATTSWFIVGNEGAQIRELFTRAGL